ncbi:inactive histone-lysine N-methyltransferase 2E [Camponotus floridanus]|uniref:inactive histone-lysine N-methyltransferase 2E n=1 Tax=Camponotus floridanus TaxID=104421 RepID=UPI00059CB48C|nr:inactive histone-lysine N-methyltransferase 2E [Camponotus floridanus]XP_011253815.1 inactive histone-lysine N-methyltransferase 2E [Camponotus floridanus]XP_011253816.1 inactive histone-lysine N-methyltransferase 2E [Camponotus floridanus]XP_011253817.1 inactive histone-lysine N-methyltransferase 2E [Camponotus floridanus]XP_011253818.1 inactive histone-lysine N-methyltransferase 2E [Camponotus floridanus]
MKPQKKAVVARKATKMPTVAKKRRTFIEKTMSDVRKEKKSKKNDKMGDPKKKIDNDKKKLEKVEDRKKFDDKKKMEEKRKERSDKPDEKKKQLIKDYEKKSDKIDERKIEKGDDKTNNEEINQETVDKKKLSKCEEKAKLEKQFVDNKKKVEKTEEKKKNIKFDDNTNMEDNVKSLNTMENKDAFEDKIDALPSLTKKRSKDEKKKDGKLVKSDAKTISKNSTAKDKKSDRKKISEKDAASNKLSSAKTKKDSKTKQSQKKSITRKTVLTKKPHLSIVKRLVDKKIKLVKPIKSEEMSEDEDAVKKAKKKNSNIAKNKILQEKKPKLAKHMKAKLPQKHSKISVLKREDKLKAITEKIMARKKIELKESEETEHKKVASKDEASQGPEVSSIKSEIVEDSDKRKEESFPAKIQDNKKAIKSGNKISSKTPKKAGKTIKVQTESNNQTSASSEDVSSEESNKHIKVSEDNVKSAKQEQIGAENTVELDLKVEAMNGESASGITSQSDSEDDFDDEYKKSKQKDAKNKDRANSPSDERTRGMRLFGFWSKPKPPRVASLNALAKVHCLYENETGGVYLGGFCKSKPEKEKEKPKKMKEEKEEQPRKEKEKKVECKTEDNVLKRKLRNVPGLRGKHWDMLESSSSSSSSDEDCEKEKNAEPSKKKMTKRRKKNEEVMDLKDMVVCKRMASLNATAILAASYSDEKNLCGSSSSDTSSESEVEIIKRRRQNDLDVDKKKSRQGSDPEEVIKPSKKVVIVNQDTDVTITGVYVNQTRSTHHEGFCSIAGMQYRISSTSHTQTAATAVATELHDQQKTEQPCKSYTPLGALSSMQPPGSQGNHPNMSPRRHSAFSAPHQHGYYQPAGPLIQHPPPPTLPPVKGPPPEPTPTPPQNSEGSDDLVATSTTSGGTSSTGGGFYRTYCPQYYGTPPQYPDLCYPPTYSHPHAHPPHYYKYPPTYRRQYYGYQESGGGGGPPPGSGAAGGGPGVVDYQPPPPPPGEYPLPPYYGGYPPPPHPPPPPNPAYLHSQGRPFVDPFQGCPCPMQSCPKNVDTGALIGNGKGAPVVSGPGLSLPPSALVGPPSPARGLAGLAPPHGANAWDTDRVQINTHRNLNQNQPPSVPPSHNLVGGHSRLQNQDCRSKDEKNCTEDTLRKCGCQNACTSTCEVKMETLSPTEKLSVAATCPSSKSQYHNFKLENNNVKCESCSMEIADGLPCVANCNVVKCESDYKCDIMKCEQCMKEGQIAILEMDKDSGIVLDDKLDGDPDVKEELDVVVIDGDENWKKPDYEPTVQETVDDKEDEEEEEEEEITQGPVAAEIEAEVEAEEQLKCQKVTKRKLSLDSLSDSRKKRKLSKRALSVGSSQDSSNERLSNVIAPIEPLSNKTDSVKAETNVPKKKQAKKDAGPRGQKRKAETPSANESATKKAKSGKQSAANSVMNCLKRTASDISIMETIDDVIQQSLQMTQRKDRKNKNCERMEKKKKNMKEESLLTVKRIAKKLDQVKEQFIEKVSKAISKNGGQSKSKADAKLKSKISQDAKIKGGKSKVAKTFAETKAQDTKTRVTQDSKARDGSKKRDTASKTKTSDVSEDPKKPALIKKKRKNAKKTANAKKSGCKLENSSVGNESLTLTRKTFLKPKWNNGWSWEGEPFEAKVYLTNEETAIRRCYASMSHESGDVLRPRDCVLLKSGTRKGDLPYVAKIAALWENPDDGEMMFSLLWYYRPEHTEQGRTPHDSEDEVFASRHRDANSVACIEDKCYILTFNEYCRYRKNLRRIEEGLENPGLIVPPGDQVYPRENRQPPIPVPSDMVLFCRRVYDYRGKKLVKNPG